MSRTVPLLARFFSKLVLDILPAALASVIDGLLFTHFDWSQVPFDLSQVWATAPAVERAAPASPEMMQLVRDEHAAVLSYVKAQVAAERNRLAAEDAAAAKAASEARSIAPAPGGAAVAAVEAKPLAPAAQPVVQPLAQPLAQEPAPPVAPVTAAAPTPQAPLMIAQAERGEGIEPASYQQAPLVAATVNIKDHVVATTQHAFTLIGGIPSWIVGLGGRIAGQGDASAPPAGRLAGESG